MYIKISKALLEQTGIVSRQRQTKHSGEGSRGGFHRQDAEAQKSFDWPQLKQLPHLGNPVGCDRCTYRN